MRINNRRFATQAFTPAIRVDDDGNVAVIYYDFRNNVAATPRLETDVWMVRSTDGGATWREERVTPASFDMRAAPVANGYFTGDYIGLAAEGTRFNPFWSASENDADGTDAFGAVAVPPFAWRADRAGRRAGGAARAGLPGAARQADAALTGERGPGSVPAPVMMRAWKASATRLLRL